MTTILGGQSCSHLLQTPDASLQLKLPFFLLPTNLVIYKTTRSVIKLKGSHSISLELERIHCLIIYSFRQHYMRICAFLSYVHAFTVIELLTIGEAPGQASGYL